MRVAGGKVGGQALREGEEEEDVEEDEGARQRMADDLANGYYGDVAERMSIVRSYDLNLVDRSDFIVAHIVPDVASWGSAEELVTAVRMKKPTFVSVEGGKNKTPLWLLGMMPHNYFYIHKKNKKHFLLQVLLNNLQLILSHNPHSKVLLFSSFFINNIYIFY